MSLIEKVGRVVTQSTSDAHPSVGATSPDNIYVDEVLRLRAENARLRAERPAPATPGPREVYDAADVDALVQRALAKALAEDCSRPSAKRKAAPAQADDEGG